MAQSIRITTSQISQDSCPIIVHCHLDQLTFDYSLRFLNYSASNVKVQVRTRARLPCVYFQNQQAELTDRLYIMVPAHAQLVIPLLVYTTRRRSGVYHDLIQISLTLEKEHQVLGVVHLNVPLTVQVDSEPPRNSRMVRAP